MSEKLLEETESKYMNLSFVIYVKSFKRYIDREKVDIKSYLYQEWLKHYVKVGEYILEHLGIYLCNESFIFHLLLSYANTILGIGEEILDDYLYLLKHNLLDKFIKIEVKNGSITYNIYNSDKLLKLLKGDEVDLKSYADTSLFPMYAMAFYHISMLLIFISFLEDSQEECNLFKFADMLNSGVLGGIRCSYEFHLPFPYKMLSEELLQLSSLNKKKLSLSYNPDKYTTEFKIHDASIILERYRLEGYHNFPYEFTKADFGYKCSLRVIQGNYPNTVKFILSKSSGINTINKLFTYNRKIIVDGVKKNNNIKPVMLYDSAISCIRNLTCFTFQTTLDYCNTENIIPTDYYAQTRIINYLKKKNKRNIFKKLAIICLLYGANNKEKKDILSKFTPLQKQELLKELETYKRYKNEKPFFILKAVRNYIRRYYVW